MVGDASLRIIVGTDLRRAVAGGNHRLTFVSNVIQIFLVFLVIYKRTQAREGAFLVLRLVARFGTFDQDFFAYACIRVLSDIAQADA